MGLKKKPGLAGGPDIKGGPSYPKPGSRLGKDGYWGDGDTTVSSSASCLFHTSFPRRLGWEGSLIPSLPLYEVAMDRRVGKSGGSSLGGLTQMLPHRNQEGEG